MCGFSILRMKQDLYQIKSASNFIVKTLSGRIDCTFLNIIDGNCSKRKLVSFAIVYVGYLCTAVTLLLLQACSVLKLH